MSLVMTYAKAKLARFLDGKEEREAHVILGLELTDFWGTVNEMDDSAGLDQKLRIKPGTKLISSGEKRRAGARD